MLYGSGAKSEGFLMFETFTWGIIIAIFVAIYRLGLYLRYRHYTEKKNCIAGELWLNKDSKVLKGKVIAMRQAKFNGKETKNIPDYNLIPEDTKSINIQSYKTE